MFAVTNRRVSAQQPDSSDPPGIGVIALHYHIYAHNGRCTGRFRKPEREGKVATATIKISVPDTAARRRGLRAGCPSRRVPGVRSASCDQSQAGRAHELPVPAVSDPAERRRTAREVSAAVRGTQWSGRKADGSGFTQAEPCRVLWLGEAAKLASQSSSAAPPSRASDIIARRYDINDDFQYGVPGGTPSGYSLAG